MALVLCVCQLACVILTTALEGSVVINISISIPIFRWGTEAERGLHSYEVAKLGLDPGQSGPSVCIFNHCATNDLKSAWIKLK